MTNPTEIVETESVQVTEVVEDHHKASLKERIVDKLTGHHSHEHKKEGEEHHNSNDFADKALLTAENPVFPQSMGSLGHGFAHQGHSAGGYIVGIPHENPHKHTEGEHHHHHHEDKEDKFQKYGDKVAGTDYHAASVPVHHPVK